MDDVLRRVIVPLLLLIGLARPASAEAAGPCLTQAPPRGWWAAGDFDGDAVVDLALVTDSHAATVALRPLCSPQLPIVAATGPGDVTLTMRDLDADRDLDLILSRRGGGPIRVWLNDGRGRFRETAGEIAAGEAAAVGSIVAARRAHAAPRSPLSRHAAAALSPDTVRAARVPDTGRRDRAPRPHVAMRAGAAVRGRAPPALSR